MLRPYPSTGMKAFTLHHAAKGAAVSAWEAAEVRFCRLYAAAFLGNPSDKDNAAVQAYGSPLNFKDRFDVLQSATTRYFQHRCHQVLEGDFLDIAELARKLSVRRNEIVHSVVRPVIFKRTLENPDGQTLQWVNKFRFFLVPPTYTDRKYDSRNRPAFMYTSVEINEYGTWFTYTGLAALNLALRLSNPRMEPFGRKHPLPKT